MLINLSFMHLNKVIEVVICCSKNLGNANVTRCVQALPFCFLSIFGCEAPKRYGNALPIAAWCFPCVAMCHFPLVFSITFVFLRLNLEDFYSMSK